MASRLLGAKPSFKPMLETSAIFFYQKSYICIQDDAYENVVGKNFGQLCLGINVLNVSKS